MNASVKEKLNKNFLTRISQNIRFSYSSECPVRDNYGHIIKLSGEYPKNSTRGMIPWNFYFFIFELKILILNFKNVQFEVIDWITVRYKIDRK